MPYDNKYNREIAKQYLDTNRKFVDHQEKNNEIFHMTAMPFISHSSASKQGGAIRPQHLNDDVKYGVNQGVRAVFADASQYGSNNDDDEKYMNGGSGFAKGTHMDTGYDRTLGAGKSDLDLKGSKIFKKASLKLVKSDLEGGKRRRGRPSKKDLEGGNIFNDIKDGFMSVIKPVASVAKNILKVIPDPRFQMAGQALDAFGAGKKTRGRPRKIGGTNLGLPSKVLEGGKKTRGRPRKVGGMGIDDNNLSGGRKLVPVANMKASYMAGQGQPKRTNKRAELVKKIMAEKKMSMIDASSYIKKNNMYKP